MFRKITFLLCLSALCGAAATAQFTVSGTVRDAKTGDPILGAYVNIRDTYIGAITAADGSYALNDVAAGQQIVVFSFIGYTEVERGIELSGNLTDIDAELTEEATAIGEVVVRGRLRSDTENAMLGTVRMARQVVSGISAAQIARSPDRTASEVVRRVPGITIIDDRFIIVRGLAQRYNNAWINGLAVPSTETDSRAFSFDIVPGSQIDNLLVYKSPSPEIPGDFSGGFVKIATKGVPEANRTEIGFQTGFNVRTQFTDFRRSDGWRIESRTPLPDRRLTLMLARRFETKGGKTFGNITAVNYSDTHKTNEGIRNTRYGIYSAAADRPIVLNDYTDNQYAHDVRLGAMHNWSLALDRNNRLEFKNLFNLLTRDRLTERSGTSQNSGVYYQEQTEMLYNSRLTYTGQFSGVHNLKNEGTLSWDAGYSYANRNEPDRRIARYEAGISEADDTPAPGSLYIEQIKRYYQELDDHNVSAALNYKQPLGAITLSTGLYGELRTRNYVPQEFEYNYRNLPYEERQIFMHLPLEEMMTGQYLRPGGVTLDERPEPKLSAYSAEVMYGAAYGAVEIPLGPLSLYAGARLESHTTELTYDTQMDPDRQQIVTARVEDLDLLPSVNLTWKFNDKHQLRAAYGRSVNRPELRELSPAVYYDFDLFSEIGGNPDLKTAKIDNADLRYEFYPALGETVSFGAFYKHFVNPIEWTFIDMGGTYRYLYQNAKEAVSWGFELDVRKNLAFMGMRNFSLVLNAAWIESNVRFNPGEVVSEPDRPMQGQSPYIVNAGLYYASEKLGLDVSLLYNRIGERIVGLGKTTGIDPDPNSVIPDSYEMPRNTLDLSLTKRLGRRLELRASVKDLLSEEIVYKQFPHFVRDGVEHQRCQTTRRYNPGQSVSIGLSVKW